MKLAGQVRTIRRKARAAVAAGVFAEDGPPKGEHARVERELATDPSSYLAFAEVRRRVRETDDAELAERLWGDHTEEEFCEAMKPLGLQGELLEAAVGERSGRLVRAYPPEHRLEALLRPAFVDRLARLREEEQAHRRTHQAEKER